MDVRSGCPFWVLQAGEQGEWPELAGNHRTDVVVIGGGVTGALAAWRLAVAGIDTTLLDRGGVGLGSTAASTALLQYEIDTPLVELRRLVGSERADRAYRRCLAALDEVEEIIAALGHRCGHARRESLFLASEERDIPAFRAEALERRKLGIPVEFLERGELARSFGIARPGALLSARGAEIDAYALTLRLVEAAAAAGAMVRTGAGSAVVALETAGGRVAADTAGGARIDARRAIIATGYELAPWLSPSLATVASTYAVASAVMPDGPPWPRHALIWERADPYLYLRTTADGRMIIGGEDEPVADPAARDALLDAKTERLLQRARELFPGSDPVAECAWAGTFAETPDGLPYIGEVPGRPGVYASLAYGGNGITFGVIAADLLLGLCRDGGHPDAGLFGFDR